jgi:hypothetical protein
MCISSKQMGLASWLLGEAPTPAQVKKCKKVFNKTLKKGSLQKRFEKELKEHYKKEGVVRSSAYLRRNAKNLVEFSQSKNAKKAFNMTCKARPGVRKLFIGAEAAEGLEKKISVL